MLDAATARRDAHIADCATLDEAGEAAQTGVARVPWDVVGVAGEEKLAAAGVTVSVCSAATGRCLTETPTRVRWPTSPGRTEFQP